MLPVDTKDPEEFKYVFRGNGDIMNLPGVMAVPPEAPNQTEFISMWQPSEEERQMIAKGHPVVVRILNNGRPIFPYAVAVAKYHDRILEFPIDAERDINDDYKGK